MIAEAISDYLLPWRVTCSMALALLVAFSVCWLFGGELRVDIIFAGLIVGLVAGIAWQSRRG